MKASVQSIVLSPDQKKLFISDSEGQLKAWEIESRTILTDGKVHENTILSMKLSNDGKFLYTGSFDKSAKILNIDDED